MAVQYPYIMEAIDVRRADQPDTSRAKIIKKMALPGLKRITAEHMAGGAIAKLNLSFPQIEQLEPKFSTAGFDLDIMRKYGFAAGVYDRWVFAGSVRIRKGGVIPARAIIEGVINEWTPGENTPGEIADCDHALQEVTHYEFTLDGEEMFYFDDDENVARSGGSDWFAATRRALGI